MEAHYMDWMCGDGASRHKGRANDCPSRRSLLVTKRKAFVEYCMNDRSVPPTFKEETERQRMAMRQFIANAGERAVREYKERHRRFRAHDRYIVEYDKHHQELNVMGSRRDEYHSVTPILPSCTWK
ncbi:hypothetical protein KIPB_011152 [Kipferlia bialata]|uniref:Uncharacterized protein n=1 Tax=Kipferlia bialata TaxID=797122 RepID=A0A9K3D4R0_9EUKA|nr:hypothetical protein KIPB_011152 [Kipferlia bialata]|eukprot:g11152.t1